MYCPNCGTVNNAGARFCMSCGMAMWEAGTLGRPGYSTQHPRPTKSKVTAGILAILLGGLGIHKFYLGDALPGILLIIVTVVTCGIVGPIIGLIEGILYLTKTDEEFYNTYEVNRKEWF